MRLVHQTLNQSILIDLLQFESCINNIVYSSPVASASAVVRERFKGLWRTPLFTSIHTSTELLSSLMLYIFHAQIPKLMQEEMISYDYVIAYKTDWCTAHSHHPHAIWMVAVPGCITTFGRLCLIVLHHLRIFRSGVVEYCDSKALSFLVLVEFLQGFRWNPVIIDILGDRIPKYKESFWLRGVQWLMVVPHFSVTQMIDAFNPQRYKLLTMIISFEWRHNKCGQTSSSTTNAEVSTKLCTSCQFLTFNMNQEYSPQGPVNMTFCEVDYMKVHFLQWMSTLLFQSQC